MSKPKRDNAYYEQRLKDEKPQIYKDLIDGVYPNVHQAAIAAGLKKQPTVLEQLKRLWAKADAKEQGEFRDFINPGTPAVGGPVTGPAFRPDGRFEPWARTRVREIMDRRVMESGDVCREIGKNTLNPSLGNALHRDTRIRDASMRAKLEKWIKDNESV